LASNSTNNQSLVVWHGDDTTDNHFDVFGQRFSPAALSPPIPFPAPLPPPLPPPAPVQIVAAQLRRNGVARVRVRDARTGALRGILTPFRGFAGRLALQLQDLTGDGALDLVVKAMINGRHKKRVYDAVTLARL